MRLYPFQATLGLVGLALLLGAAGRAETPKEAVGFFGTMTGVVKSAQADGTSFVLTVSKAEPDVKMSAVKDGGPIAGKVIALGTRMPKDKEGKAHPHEADVTFIKSLKPGEEVTVKVFAIRADPSVLRITGPGESTTKPATPTK